MKVRSKTLSPLWRKSFFAFFTGSADSLPRPFQLTPLSKRTNCDSKIVHNYHFRQFEFSANATFVYGINVGDMAFGIRAINYIVKTLQGGQKQATADVPTNLKLTNEATFFVVKSEYWSTPVGWLVLDILCITNMWRHQFAGMKLRYE